MEIAPDGKPYDVVYIGKVSDTEAEIIQFLRPNARRRKMSCEVGEELAQLSRNMVLSSEDLQNGTITIWGRMKSTPEAKELIEIAENGPGPNSPKTKLKNLIRKVAGLR